MKRALIVSALILWSVPTALDAQAFGVQMGEPVSKYQGRTVASLNDPYYFRITVPQPNNEFESYSAIATPQTGICKVTGLGKTHENDSYGTEVRSSFDNLKVVLDGRYGKSERFDFLKAGALWKEPREWVWSIYKGERTLTAFWTVPNGSRLPANVNAIMLDTKSVNASSGAYVTLGYEFSNFAQCKAVMERSQNSGL